MLTYGGEPPRSLRRREEDLRRVEAAVERSRRAATARMREMEAVPAAAEDIPADRGTEDDPHRK